MIDLPIGMAITPVEVKHITSCKSSCALYGVKCNGHSATDFHCAPAYRKDRKHISYKLINLSALYNTIGRTCKTCKGCKRKGILDFGDYVIIEQKRHGIENEMYIHKVITQSNSNTWVDIPVQSPATETIHKEMEDIVWCICCGVCEDTVRKYRVKDVKKANYQTNVRCCPDWVFNEAKYQ